ncbi:hypothetical protein [Clostridium sp.]|uniref:hypothetical protein n=1 Tax=Clostridium sp. TaxID=1506 RepID=UPI00291158BB|nr:hypothetical protein [Clostridium sp.]MDU6522151.1 hypothetical protein [Clostridium sp.]
MLNDIDPEQMIIYVNDDTIKAGIYTVVIAETVSGKVFEILFEFYREGQKIYIQLNFMQMVGKE